MSPDLEKQIAELLKSAQAAGQDALTFVQAQAPDLIQQILAWETVSAKLGVALGAGMLIFGLILGLFIWKKHDEIAGACVVWTIFAFFGFCVLGVNLYELTRVLYAPKLVVLNYFRHL